MMKYAEDCTWLNYAFQSIKSPGGKITLDMVPYCQHREDNPDCASCSKYKPRETRKWDIYTCPQCEADLFIPFEQEGRFTNCFSCGATISDNTPFIC